MMARVMIASGGTGGHVFPALAVANELRERGIEISWLGTQKGMENTVVPAANISLDQISALGFRGKGGLAKLIAIKGFVIGCFEALKILRNRKPHIVLGMGGYVTAPAGLMAHFMRIPVVIHEQNRVIGTANRLLSKIATQILEAFPDTFPAKNNAIYTGNPLRNDIIELAKMNQQPERSDETLRLLVLGGSQGARSLNQIIPQAISDSEITQIEIVHQSGEQWFNETSDKYTELGINAKVQPFIGDMSAIYQWADLVICRAGAMTISELAAVCLPSILVPYPFAIDDHQTQNARYLVDAGAAVLIEDKRITSTHLAKELLRLTSNKNQLSTMRKALKALSRIDATQRVADLCLQEIAA